MRNLTTLAVLFLTASPFLVGCSSTKSDVQSTDRPKSAEHGDMASMLPPGMTEADMMACMQAGTPGEEHALLAKSAGRWSGKSTMWMAPGTTPMTNACFATMTPLMDGRFVHAEYKGDMEGMGPFHGIGFYGFDNVTQEYVSTWIDNMGTGIMTGTGEASNSGKTITWNYVFNDPMTKKPMKMREVESHPDANTMTLEAYMADRATGKEFLMMRIEMKRTSDA